MIRVVYVDGDGPFGGASRSLSEVAGRLAGDRVEARFLASEGTALEVYRRFASDIVAVSSMSKFDNTRYSHYRGVRWLILLRELFLLPRTWRGARAAARRWQDADLIHLNEVTYLPAALLLRRWLRRPMLVHVRSLQRVAPSSWRTRWVDAMLRRHAGAVVAINLNTRQTLPADMTVDVIQNSFTARRPAQPDDAMAARLDALRPTSLKVGFVGNLHHSKGLFEMLDAACLLRDRGYDVDFVLVGGVTIPDRGLKAWLLARAGLAQNVQAELAERIAQARLEDRFHLLGATLDIKCVYDRIDVLCFASHYDAPGRPVFEAAFSGVPSIVAVDRPQPDTLVDGETGIAIPARDPQALAQAVARLADDRALARRMGENARRLAEAEFDPGKNADKLHAVYQRLVQRAQPR